ncbi:MAG TPA: tetratricopeptide repeat protein [Phycisphaerae bacterium]|nr:tetratricopeptide repeat protein [Phycisphaerae bacterium]
MSQISIQEALNIAAQHHQAGRLAQAEAIYRQILAGQPNHAETLHSLGAIAFQTGKIQVAAELIRRAIAINPTNADYYNSLGSILRSQSRLAEAMSAYRTALKLNPNYADAYYNLGAAWRAQGRLDEAIAAYQNAIRIKPDFVLAHNNLGNVFQIQGELDAAIGAYRTAIQIKPDFAEAHNNLGFALQAQRRFDEAMSSYKEALRLAPKYADAYNNLGTLLQALDQLEAAATAYQKALHLKPNEVLTLSNLGSVLQLKGELDAAIAVYRSALKHKPYSAAAHSCLIYVLGYHPNSDAKTLQKELIIWNQRHAEPLKQFIRPHGNSRDPERRLKIGYVSADFREHVVGWNFLPFLEQHDHQQFDIFCYSATARPDAMTKRIRDASDEWRNIAGIIDEQAAEMIRSDTIDILVDLSLHTAGYRLLVFARKPAPIQVTYLGYPGSTGLDTIDYRFSDACLDPPETDLSVYSEQTVRLPETYWCYQPGGQVSECVPPPALSAGFITFGCMNNFAKASQPAQDLWANILQAVPHAKLIIHSHSGTHRDQVRERFRQRGIVANQIEFVGTQPWPEYINTYNRIDISLDPFPYNGGITTCDSLYMGVPVVSLSGKTAVGRAGKSILTNAGLQELIAQTPEEYVQIAVKLARDSARLKELRAMLREQIQQSPLMNAKRFAHHVEAAYRDMWRKWCGCTEKVE